MLQRRAYVLCIERRLAMHTGMEGEGKGEAYHGVLVLVGYVVGIWQGRLARRSCITSPS